MKPQSDMPSDDQTLRVQSLVEQFTIPAADSLDLFVNARLASTTMYFGIAVYKKSCDQFYPDIWTFWVRAFFCFIEDTWSGDLFTNKSINCREVSIMDFRENLFAGIGEIGSQNMLSGAIPLAASGINLDKLVFSEAWQLFGDFPLQSAVADAGTEYIAYFCRTFNKPL